MTEKELVCSFCGTTTQLSTIDCENHPGELAVGVCTVCAKPVCGDCATSVQDVIYCDQPDHQKMRTEWADVYTSSSDFEADAVVRNLASEGIETKVFSMNDHVSAFWFEEYAIVRVMSRTTDKERALTVLKQLQLIEDRPGS